MKRVLLLSAAAVALYPLFGPSRAQLGFLALREGRNGEARQLLEDALAAQWPHADVARALAEANLVIARRPAASPPSP
jgi:hypothetical protein